MTTPLRILGAVALGVARSGCSDMALSVKGGDTNGLPEAGDGSDALHGILTVNVSPAASELGLLPQGFTVYPRRTGSGEDRYSDLDLALLPTVRLSGTLTAETSQAYSSYATTAPTEVGPLSAQVWCEVPDTLLGAAAATDDTGHFEMSVVGDEPYVSLHFMGAERYAR